MAVPFLSCMVLVAHLYHLPPRVLPSIQAVEDGRVGTVSLNANGTEDLGVMQINTLWLPALARVAHQPISEIRGRLINRPCFNIAAAAAILRLYIDENHGDLMRAVGDYHSHTPQLNADYRLKVMSSARRLFQPG